MERLTGDQLDNSGWSMWCLSDTTKYMGEDKNVFLCYCPLCCCRLFNLSAVECVVKSVTSDPSAVLTRAQRGSAGRDSRLRGRKITINQEKILELEPNTWLRRHMAEEGSKGETEGQTQSKWHSYSQRGSRQFRSVCRWCQQMIRFGSDPLVLISPITNGGWFRPTCPSV